MSWYIEGIIHSYQQPKIFRCCSVVQSCPILCDPMDWSIPGFSVLHHLLELTLTHVHWVSDTIQPSHPVSPFSSCPQSFPASGSFPMRWLFASGRQSTEASASASILPMNIQGWLPLESTGLISLQSKGLSSVFSSNTVQSTSCEMPGWVKHKLESRLPGEISIISDMQMRFLPP